MSNQVSVRYPFTLNGGKVQMTNSAEEVAVDRVVFCLSTEVGERVMRPTWGVNIMKSLWELNHEGRMTEVIQDAVQAVFRSRFPQYHLKSLRISNQYAEDPTTYTVEVTFRDNPNSQFDISTRVGVQVPGGAEIYDQERAYS